MKPIVLSGRDTLRVLEILKKPPSPPAKLSAAAKAFAANRKKLTG